MQLCSTLRQDLVLMPCPLRQEFFNKAFSCRTLRRTSLCTNVTCSTSPGKFTTFINNVHLTNQDQRRTSFFFWCSVEPSSPLSGVWILFFFFCFCSSVGGQFGAIWDRGSLVAINPRDRQRWDASVSMATLKLISDVLLCVPGMLLSSSLWWPKTADTCWTRCCTTQTCTQVRHNKN